MSYKQIKRAGIRAVLTSLLLTFVFATGALTGAYFYPRLAAEAEHEHDDDHADEHHDSHDDEAHHHMHEDEEDHVALSEQAYGNLDLKLGLVFKGDYWKSLLVPAQVVEIPGTSNLSVSAPVTGVVKDVRVLSGQTIVPKEPLFVIRLTDEALIDAQSKLLQTLIRQELAQKEINRLAPLIDTGAISGGKKRTLEYELKQLEAQRATLVQELCGRGLPKAMIDKLLKDRVLASELTVHSTGFLNMNGHNSDGTTGYSVEELLVQPGISVAKGQSLCTVAYHAKLYLEGTAFEDDMPILDSIAENNWQVSLGAEGESESDVERFKLPLLRVDNHIDEETQTVKFFVELTNEVTRVKNSNGRMYEHWRFRPGQRLHVRLPVEKWQNQLTLPVDAVVVDGPNAFVFVEHHHDEDEDHHDDHAHAHDDDDHHHHDASEPFIEFESVPVRILYRDDRTVVVADDNQVPLDQPIVMKNAYKLYLAMKMQSGGGGGHHHHHDH